VRRAVPPSSLPGNAPRESLRSVLANWAQTEGLAWVYIFKAALAAMLTLWIAMRLDMPQPRTAMTTVFVVMQPQSGMVLAKSFYRILGTIAGVLVTIALVFGLAQYGELFVAAIAVWICFCNFAARAVRNFASYGFQLAGYTVAIVAIPAALEPTGAYPLVVARCTEIAISPSSGDPSLGNDRTSVG